LTTSTRRRRPNIPDADPLALERQVCFALSIASRSVLAIYRPLLEPMGLTHPQYLVMLALWGRSPLSVKEIGQSLALDSATLSPLLKRLEAAGYLSRVRSTSDERQLAVELTPAIIAKLGIGLDELEALHGALTQVIAAAQGAGIQP
jgi:DNA-binding MarR family transcriptional regulator